MLNISINDIIFISRPSKKITNTGVLFHLGAKILTGFKSGQPTDPLSGKPINFLNTFAASGIYFQTGAWETVKTGEPGIFWLALRYLASYTERKEIQKFLPDIQTSGVYYGWSVGGGIEINSVVNLKLIYYKYEKAPEIDYSLPIYHFSFNYTLKK